MPQKISFLIVKMYIQKNVKFLGRKHVHPRVKLSFRTGNGFVHVPLPLAWNMYSNNFIEKQGLLARIDNDRFYAGKGECQTVVPVIPRTLIEKIQKHHHIYIINVYLSIYYYILKAQYGV
jgi:hypothetical protein